MPKSIGGLVGWTVGAVLVSMVGTYILSRTPIWGQINKGG